MLFLAITNFHQAKPNEKLEICKRQKPECKSDLSPCGEDGEKISNAKSDGLRVQPFCWIFTLRHFGLQFIFCTVINSWHDDGIKGTQPSEKIAEWIIWHLMM